MRNKFVIKNIPDHIPDIDKVIFKSRIDVAYRDLLKVTDEIPEVVQKEHKDSPRQQQQDTEHGIVNFSALAITPLYTFDRLILPEETLLALKNAANIFKVKQKVFVDWGLYEIEPHPKSALNFYGPSGTGKTMAAHAIASLLGKKIIVASYAEIESKYHGDGPKNVKALFSAFRPL